LFKGIALPQNKKGKEVINVEKEELARINLYNDRLVAASGMPDSLTEEERQDLTVLLEKSQREQGIHILNHGYPVV